MRLSPAVITVVVICLLSIGCSRSAEYYTRKANELSSSGDYAAADLNYRKALQHDSRSAEVYFRLGINQLKLGNSQAAFGSLNRALELAPAREDIQIAMGDLCLAGFIADTNRPKILYERVNSISDQLLAKHSDSYPGLRMKGYLSLVDSHPAEAAEYFRRANRQRGGRRFR